MKKAKIMLVAIAVVATVSGALAFKTAKYANIFLFVKQGSTCPRVANITTVGTLTATDAYTTTLFTASVPTSLCTSTIEYATE